MNEIIIENRIIVDAWNRHCKLHHYRQEIVSENRVTVDLEIATEVWVTADVWSRQRQRIHERRIKPIAKIDSSLTHGFVKHTMSHSRTRNHLWKLSHDWRMELTAHTNSRLTNEINIENRVNWRMKSLVKTVSQPTRNRQWKLSHCRTRNHLWKLSQGWRMESTTNTNSLLRNEINRQIRVIVDAWNR